MWKVKNPEYRERIEKYLKLQHFMHQMHFGLEEISPGKTSGVLQLEQIHRQQFGRVHGGVIATMADITAGFAAYTLVAENEHVVTGEIKLSYYSAARTDRLRAVGKVIKPGRRMHFCEADIFELHKDGSERLIARATTSMVVIPAEER